MVGFSESLQAIHERRTPAAHDGWQRRQRFKTEGVNFTRISWAICNLSYQDKVKFTLKRFVSRLGVRVAFDFDRLGFIQRCRQPQDAKYNFNVEPLNGKHLWKLSSEQIYSTLRRPPMSQKLPPPPKNRKQVAISTDNSGWPPRGRGPCGNCSQTDDSTKKGLDVFISIIKPNLSAVNWCQK